MNWTINSKKELSLNSQKHLRKISKMFKLQKILKVFFSLILLVMITFFPSPGMVAEAAVPRWAYSRVNISSCYFQQAEKMAENALKKSSLRGVTKSGNGNIQGNTSDVMVLVFIENTNYGRKAIVVATGSGADGYRNSVKKELESQSHLSKALECGIDRPGGDYKSFAIDDDPLDCMRACSGDSPCKAFTYVKPGYQGSKARCWLKNTLPPSRLNSATISGQFS